MLEYTNKSFNCLEAMEIYQQFKDQEMESSLETLNNMFKLRDTTNSVKDAHQELINQINQSQERLNQLLEENAREIADRDREIARLLAENSKPESNKENNTGLN